MYLDIELLVQLKYMFDSEAMHKFGYEAKK